MNTWNERGVDLAGRTVVEDQKKIKKVTPKTSAQVGNISQRRPGEIAIPAKAWQGRNEGHHVEEDNSSRPRSTWSRACISIAAISSPNYPTRQDGSIWKPYSSSTREDLACRNCSRLEEVVQNGKPLNYRRGLRGRSARDARGEQAAAAASRSWQ